MSSPSRHKTAVTSSAELDPTQRSRSPRAEMSQDRNGPPKAIGRVTIEGVLAEDSESAPDNISRQHMLDRIDRLVLSLQQDGHSKLRDHQVDVMHDLAEFIGNPPVGEDGNVVTWGYVRLPTGSGKTVIFSTLAGVLSTQGEDEQTPKGLILVPKLDLIEQTKGESGIEGKERGLAAFAGGVATSIYTGRHKSLDGDVVVMTYQSLLNAVKAGLVTKDMFDYIVCDEVHRSLGPITCAAIESIAGTAPVIGFTATSDFERKSVSDHFPEEIHSADLREAIELGWLSPVRAIAIDTNFELGEAKGGSDFMDEELEALITHEWRNEKAVEFACDFVTSGQQGLISCVPGGNLAHARLITSQLNEQQVVDARSGLLRNIRAVTVDGKMDPDMRKAIYKDYENGLIDVIAYVDLLTEGWDSDVAQFLINLRPTSSPVNAIQRLGRILRRVPGKIATVVEFIDKTQRPIYTFWHAMGEDEITQGRIYMAEDEALEGSQSTEDDTMTRLEPRFSDELRKLIAKIHHVAVKDMVVERQVVEKATADDLILRDVLHEYRMSRKLFNGLCIGLEAKGIPVLIYSRIFDGSVRAAISRATLEEIREALEHHRPRRQEDVVLLARLRERYNMSSQKILEIAEVAEVTIHRRNVLAVTNRYTTPVLAYYIDPEDADKLDAACKSYIMGRHEQLLLEGGRVHPFGKYDVRMGDLLTSLGITEKQFTTFLESVDPEQHPQTSVDTTHPTKPFKYYEKTELARILKLYAAKNGYTDSMLADEYTVRNQVLSHNPRDRLSPAEVMQLAESTPRLRKYTVLVGPKGKEARRVPKLFMREFCDALIKIRSKR